LPAVTLIARVTIAAQDSGGGPRRGFQTERAVSCMVRRQRRYDGWAISAQREI